LPGVLRRGARLGKYRIERPIGKGAFSEVFAARDTVEGRRVALKVAFDWVVREFGREAMETEARIACGLSHPNIVATRNADWIDGRFVMAADLARTHVYDYPRAWRSGAVALRIVRDVAAGLAHAHQRRLMHRDVKPENVLVFADGHAALTDFGVSRFVRPESRSYTEAGTMGYMAPEQAYGKPTLSSDVFSLGVIAYELLTGKLLKWPFTWPPERYERFRAKVPEPLRPVLQKACAFDPAERYPSAVELWAALEVAFGRVEQGRASGACGARTDPDSVRRRHGAVPAPSRPRAGDALPLPPLQRPDRRGDGHLSLVRQRRELVQGDHAGAAGVRPLRAGRAARVDGVPVVLRGPLPGERPAAAPGSARGAPLRAPRLPRRAPPVHALLPGVQAQAGPAVEPPRSARPLRPLPLAHFARVLALLRVVRAAPARESLTAFSFQW